jgi:hypothetical protein
MYYQGTIAALRDAIERIQPGVTAARTELIPGQAAAFGYLLWMCDEIGSMGTKSFDEAVKAGRWIGWVAAHAELAGIWTNHETRELIRKDRADGFDKPHQE